MTTWVGTVGGGPRTGIGCVARVGAVIGAVGTTGGTCVSTGAATMFSNTWPSFERRKSTGVAHSAWYPDSRAFRALVTAWSTGRPSDSDP